MLWLKSHFARIPADLLLGSQRPKGLILSEAAVHG